MASLLLPSSQLLLRSRNQHNVQPFLLPRSSPKTPFFVSSSPSLRQHSTSASASKNPPETFTAVATTDNKKQPEKKHLSEEEEAEEDMLWIQEKALNLVEFTGTVAQAIPGPRVGSTKLPWMLAVPLTYAVTTLVTAAVKTVNNFTSPKAQPKKLVNSLCFLLSVALCYCSLLSLSVFTLFLVPSSYSLFHTVPALCFTLFLLSVFTLFLLSVSLCSWPLFQGNIRSYR
ncbi:uncharacterized protein LOC103850672 isoform X1 [Brassica rapa]|uniref:uncharacterized protein LOC103850672 isoform X1 n=2 Tax=Brassica campestris TaxID=3711 RepID=UPI00142E64AA|nr:uncharacterized protein LOC103850672 isoform X1 [Brassica rapa]